VPPCADIVVGDNLHQSRRQAETLVDGRSCERSERAHKETALLSPSGRQADLAQEWASHVRHPSVRRISLMSYDD
jgi:hypothetical protein